MYGMVVEVVTVGGCEGEFRLCEVWEWQWMKVAGYPFWARALETVCSSCVLVTADDVRACAWEHKVRTTAILWASMNLVFPGTGPHVISCHSASRNTEEQ